jgi:hypothetical protein
MLHVACCMMGRTGARPSSYLNSQEPYWNPSPTPFPFPVAAALRPLSLLALCSPSLLAAPHRARPPDQPRLWPRPHHRGLPERVANFSVTNVVLVVLGSVHSSTCFFFRPPVTSAT